METGRMFAFEWNPLTDEVRRSADCADIIGVSGNATRELGKDSLQRIHPDDREGLILAARTLTPAKDSYKAEYRVIHSSGKIVTLQQSARGLFDSAGRMVRLVGITADITERKRAEAALRESEDRFRNMADAAPVALWVSGPDGLVSFYNKNALRFTGRTMAQLVGRNWTDLVHPDDQAGCHSALSSAVTGRRSFRIECRLLRADGVYRWVLCCGVPRFSPDGLLAGFIGSSVDITDLERAHEDAIARQKLESLGVLARGVAHDFNNLLGGIHAQAELIEADLPAGSASSEEIRRIKQGVMRGAAIVRELMVYSGQDKADLAEPVDVSRLTEEMIQLLKVAISKRAILKTDLPQNLPAVLGSAPQIRQVVMNLIMNASEAIGEQDGVITISTSRVTSRKGLFMNRAMNLPEGNYLLLEVSDTGCGMSEETKSKIFDPFFTTKFAGRGLGLATVQGIVRGHAGAINVTSALGQGTAFQVFFPCKTPA
jgi:two-component system cell cycle sensor histidine kinase/response regulator CckA